MNAGSISNGRDANLKGGHRPGDGWRDQAKPKASVTMNIESESRHAKQGAFWVLVVAVAGTIAVIMLGLALPH